MFSNNLPSYKKTSEVNRKLKELANSVELAKNTISQIESKMLKNDLNPRFVQDLEKQMRETLNITKKNKWIIDQHDPKMYNKILNNINDTKELCVSLSLSLSSENIQKISQNKKIEIKNCVSGECTFCPFLKILGIGSNHYENHIFIDNKLYPNNCPVYLNLSKRKRNKFLNDLNFCHFCLKQTCQDTKNCGERNLSLYNKRKKGFVCRNSMCRNRIELCIPHFTSNQRSLIKRKLSLEALYNISFNIY